MSFGRDIAMGVAAQIAGYFILMFVVGCALGFGLAWLIGALSG